MDDSSARISAMYVNELINVRARFEIIYGVKVNDAVIKDGKETRLDSLLKDQKVNNILLFNAIEQRSGKALLDIHVVLNPRVISQVRKWLVEEYKSIEFPYNTTYAMSINKEEY